jgi:hypothetical protein
MKKLLSIIAIVFTTQAFAAEEKLSFNVKMSFFSEYGESLSKADIKEAGWTVDKDDNYSLVKKDLLVSKLPFESCLGNACFNITKNKLTNEITASLEYSDEDNAAGGSVVVYAGRPNKLKAYGHDNSTWSIDGEAEITLK